MKGLTTSIVATLTWLTVLACGKETAQPEQSTAMVPPAATATAPAAAPYDLQFLDTMSKHHLSAIEMAGMAKGKIGQPGLKELVAKLPSDQQKEVDQMKSWRDRWYPGAASAENMQMPGMSTMNMDMSHMQSMKAGHDFDVMFIDMMVSHHESAVAMARDALSKGEHQEIKTLAQQIIDAQTKEIEQMKGLKSASGARSGTSARKH